MDPAVCNQLPSLPSLLPSPAFPRRFPFIKSRPSPHPLSFPLPSTPLPSLLHSLAFFSLFLPSSRPYHLDPILASRNLILPFPLPPPPLLPITSFLLSLSTPPPPLARALPFPHPPIFYPIILASPSPPLNGTFNLHAPTCT